VCERIRSERVESSSAPHDAVDVTVALDGNLKHQLGVVIEALVAHTSRPIHLWILCRDHGPADFDRMGRAFPEVTFTWLPCDHVDYGHVRGLLSYTTKATLDRLLLPDLLGELDRVVYIDLDVLPLGDLVELADWDLDGAPFAASARVANKSGWANLMKVAGRKGRRRTQTEYLLRWLASHHTFDFASINAGVMVLDLALMRRDDFTRNFVPFVEVYGMNDQMVLNLYGGSRHAVLPPEWNYRPSHLQLESPKLIHWAGRMKPWDQPLAPLAERWREYEAALEARMASTARQPVS
jgi:lipopolysaccharide biosynthesis glycosyltransferase